MRQIKNLYIFLVFAFLSQGCEKNTKRISGFEVHGIDVSHYQNFIHWDSVASQEIKFAFVKATEGESISDSLFQQNWEGLKNNNIRKGAYHYFHPATNVLNQFNNFNRQVQYERGDLPPVIDIEETNGRSKEEIIKSIKEWINLVETNYKVKPIIYTNFKFYNAYIGGNFDQYPIWIAKYSYEEPTLDYGDTWTFWQYGNRGRIKGIKGDVDFNVFNGSLDDLDNLSYPVERTSQLLN